MNRAARRVVCSTALVVALGLALVGGGPLAPSPGAADDGAKGALDFRKVIREAKERVFPAVVFVKCIIESREGGKKESYEVTGSGVIVSERGDFLTNWHVVDKAAEVRCLLYDGRSFHADVLGTDKDTDIAVGRLKMADDDEPVPFATLGDSSALTEGEFVMAMGAPWGMSRSVSLGIVSCTRRYLDGNSEYSLWLQTDASISPGNSGGPLVNSAGEVVGLNTRGAMSGGDLGFAVPTSTIVDVMRQIQSHGRVNWSWTGLRLQPLNDFNRDIVFGGTEGVIVAGTDPESPARRAGVQARDRLISIGGVPTTAISEEDLPDIRRRIGFLTKGEEVEIVLQRGKEQIILKLVPREKGDVEGQELDLKRWDFSVKTINQFDNPSLYFHRKAGVFVYGVRYPGNAANSGLSRGDILLKIGKTEIKTLDDVKAVHATAVAEIDQKHRLVFSVLRNGLMRQVVLDFSRDYERE